MKGFLAGSWACRCSESRLAFDRPSGLPRVGRMMPLVSAEVWGRYKEAPSVRESGGLLRLVALYADTRCRSRAAESGMSDYRLLSLSRSSYLHVMSFGRLIYVSACVGEFTPFRRQSAARGATLPPLFTRAWHVARLWRTLPSLVRPSAAGIRGGSPPLSSSLAPSGIRAVRGCVLPRNEVR